jgi:hypothetical protein
MKQHFCSAENSLIQYEKECNWCGEKEWVGLTNEEQLQLHEEWYRSMDGWGALFNSIEAKLKEKNS